MDVKLDSEGGCVVIVGDLANVVKESFLAEEGAFVFTAGVGIGNEAAVPPVSTNIKEEMMNDTITKGGGDDFASDGVMNDKGNAATGFIIMLDNAIAEIDEIFHGVELEAMFVDSMLLAFAGSVVGLPEFVEKKISKTGLVHRREAWLVLTGLVLVGDGGLREVLGELGSTAAVERVRSCLLYSRVAMRSISTSLSRISQSSRWWMRRRFSILARLLRMLRVQRRILKRFWDWTERGGGDFGLKTGRMEAWS